MYLDLYAVSIKNQPSHVKEKTMWKIAVGFIIFAAIALYLLSKGGDIDMTGEKHGSASSNIIFSLANT